VVKDTPNFIGNRLGVYNFVNVFGLCNEKGYTVEEIDSICGSAIGRQRTAVFKTIDILGLDTVAKVMKNLSQTLVDDEKKDLFKMPDFTMRMLEKEWIGDKAGKGFYMTVDEGEEMVLDLKDLEYRRKKAPNFASLAAVKKIDNDALRVKTLVQGYDEGSSLAWAVLSEDMVYAANRIGEIADSILEIDQVMRWGYYWRVVPFEAWDLLGVQWAVDRLKESGREIPNKVLTLLNSGNKSFYKEINGVKHYYDFLSGSYKPIINK
jgi:3-hydroxyacyl-CoA dehydrogenase